MAATLHRSVAVLVAYSFAAVQGQVISDLADIITPSPSVQQLALDTKADKFWNIVLGAADSMKITEHMQLYKDTEKVIAELPAENTYVREALTEVLTRLRRADESVLTQACESSTLASDQLAAPLLGQSMLSFFSGGQNFLKEAIRRFVNGGSYNDRLEEQVDKRQADILPMLRGAASATGGLLSDTRLASKRSFDVLKYDIYNKGVPKTPKAAKDIANRLVDATGETRHRFMMFITQTVNGIADDYSGRTTGAAAASVQSSLHEAVANAEADEKASKKPIVNV